MGTANFVVNADTLYDANFAQMMLNPYPNKYWCHVYVHICEMLRSMLRSLKIFGSCFRQTCPVTIRLLRLCAYHRCALICNICLIISHHARHVEMHLRLDVSAQFVQ